ncbi:hypothetical protein [Nocardia sp. GAS34]|uniref:hypothetical protein n=1 Tax=unclassified Nocardia TaxID=2637762 RepID=UPI003D1C60BE
MGENRQPRKPRPRKRSSPEVVARLQRSRRRALDRRAAARQREKAVSAAVGDYISAWHAIELAQQRRDNNIAELNNQIDYVNARAAEEIAGHEQAQAEAAAIVQAMGHSDDDIAELFEISAKQARRLIAAARLIGSGYKSDSNENRSGCAGRDKSESSQPLESDGSFEHGGGAGTAEGLRPPESLDVR